MLAYLAENKVWVSDKISIKSNPSKYSGKGFYVVTQDEPIKKGTVLAKIPKSAILSTKNCAISSEIPEPKTSLHSQLWLALCFLYEKNSPNSPFKLYIDALDDKETLPFESQKDFVGTSLEHVIPDYLMQLYHIYISEIEPWVKENLRSQLDKYSFQRLLGAFSLVTSRAFYVDHYHGDAFVPLADLFNHSSQGEHVRICSDLDVCGFCGEKRCNCEGSEEEEEEDIEMEDSNDSDSGQETLVHEQGTSDQDEDDSLENNIEIKAHRACPANSEIYNTFGLHSSSSLLLKYGFIDDIPIEVDSVSFSMTEIESFLGQAQFDRAEKLWSRYQDELVEYIEDYERRVFGGDIGDDDHMESDNLSDSESFFSDEDLEGEEVIDDEPMEDEEEEQIESEFFFTVNSQHKPHLLMAFMCFSLLSTRKNKECMRSWDKVRALVDYLLESPWSVSGLLHRKSSALVACLLQIRLEKAHITTSPSADLLRKREALVIERALSLLL